MTPVQLQSQEVTSGDADGALRGMADAVVRTKLFGQPAATLSRGAVG